MQNNTKTKINYRLIPILFIVGVIPLIVYNYIYWEPIYSGYVWYSSDKTATDTFLHAKRTWFSIITIIMMLEVLIDLIKRDKDDVLQLIKKFYPMMIYLVFVVLSTIFSLDRSLSIHGGYDQQEPFLILLGYSVTALYVVLSLRDETELKYVFYAFSFSITIMTIIGFLQFVGYNIYSTQWIRPFIMTAEQQKVVLSIADKSGVFGTLGNQNYIGTYVAMQLPIIVSFSFVSFKKHIRIISIYDSLCLLFLLVASKSATGMVSVIFVLLVAFVFLSKRLIKKWFIAAAAIAVFLITVGVINFAGNGYFLNKIKSSIFIPKAEYDLTDIDTTGDCIRLKYKKSDITIRIIYDGQGIQTDILEDGQPVEYKYDYENVLNIICLRSGEEIPFQLMRPEDDIITLELWPISIEEYSKYVFKYDIGSNDYKFLNNAGKYDESIKMQNVLDGYENLASGRGYIWGITIPLLKQYFFIGAGPDTFPVAIAKDGSDYALKINSGTFDILFNRPHNYFLQMGVLTGGISLLACMIFWVMYLIDCIKLYFWKKIDSNKRIIGFATMLSVIGFLVCGLANDSLVCVTPIFWCILGIGMTVNSWIKKENEKRA